MYQCVYSCCTASVRVFRALVLPSWRQLPVELLLHDRWMPPHELPAVQLLGREEMVDHFSSLLAGLAGLCRSLLAVRTWDDLTAVRPTVTHRQRCLVLDLSSFIYLGVSHPASLGSPGFEATGVQ